MPDLKYARWWVVGLLVLVMTATPNFRPVSGQEERPPVVMAMFPKGSGVGQVGITDSFPEMQPMGPQALSIDADGMFYILDSMNHRIVGYSPQSKVITTIGVPDAGYLQDLVFRNGQFYLMDMSRRVVWQVDQTGAVISTYPVPDALRDLASGIAVTAQGEVRWQVENNAEYTLASGLSIQNESALMQSQAASEGLSVSNDTGQALHSTSERVDKHSGTLTVTGANAVAIAETGAMPAQSLLIMVDNYLGSATLNTIDAAGNYFVLVEELLENVPAFVVDVTLRRFSPEGQLTGIAHVPIEDVYALPYHHTVVASDGQAYFLRITETEAQIIQLAFDVNYESDLAGRWKVLQAEQAVQVQIEETNSAITSAKVEPQGSITRDQIMQNAQAYLHVNWVLGPANYHTGPSSDWNCNDTDPNDPDSKIRWRLPTYLAGRLNQTIAEVPYNWGGYMSVNEFRAGINAGKRAGNICSEAIRSDSVGVDCSGFVSQVWQVAHYTTASLPGISFEINPNELRPGDILNSPGHVMLFDSFSNGQNINGGVYVYESAGYGGWRVGHNNRTFAIVSGYIPRRYSGVIETTNQPPSAPALVSPVNNTGNWLNTNTIILDWNPSTDDGLPGNSLSYFVEIWQPGKTWRAEATIADTLWTSTIPDGAYAWHVRASDGALSGNWSETWYFSVDANPPTPPNIIIGGVGCTGIQNNAWQNTCTDPAFTFSASDSGTGVKGYLYSWDGVDIIPTTYIATAAYDPPAFVAAGGDGKRYFNLKARDNLDRDSTISTFAVLYDGTMPTVTLAINNGGDQASQVNVILNLSAGDTGSGVKEARFSTNGADWTDWEPYAAQFPWTLPALDHRPNTLYAQVRDAAGNLSLPVSDAITLEMYPMMPHSALYRVCQDVVTTGGSVGLASLSYRVNSAIGQPANGVNASANYQNKSGYLVDIAACLPITYTVTDVYTVTHDVLASAGGLHDSATYRLGGTLGQTSASDATSFASASYRLVSGFWSNLTDSVPPAQVLPTPMPTRPPFPTATVVPTATPLPSDFGITINESALFTNSPNVVVRVSAPNVTQMRLSNDGGYVDSGWQTYQVASTWTLSTMANYVLPRLVYVWFRDAGNNIYGPYSDDIIYDPIPPTGYVSRTSVSGSVSQVELYARDDNSGVESMRLSENLADVFTAQWRPYQSSLSYVLSAPDSIVYAQFRDASGNVSDICASAEQSPSCPTVAASTALNITRGGTDDVTLIWPTVPDAVTYSVWRDTAPYFMPTGAPRKAEAASPFTDASVLGNPDMNYYYVITGVNACGQASGASNRVGKFEFSLKPGQ